MLKGSLVGKLDVVALGNNHFAVGGVEAPDEGPIVAIVDATDPANIEVRNLSVPSSVTKNGRLEVRVRIGGATFPYEKVSTSEDLLREAHRVYQALPPDQIIFAA